MQHALYTGVLLLCACNFCFGQHVFSSHGQAKLIDGNTIAWTIAEPITATARGSTVTFTQGFHQPNSRLLTSETDAPSRGAEGESWKASEGQIAIFPIPTSDILHLHGDPVTHASLTITLWDLQGRKIKTERSASADGRHEFSLAGISNQDYFLTIQSEGGQHLRTQKIIKVSN